MNKWLYSIAFALALLMISCANPYEKEIEEVEGMQEVLTGAKQTYSQVDIEKVSFAMETYVKNMEQIKKYYAPDTIDKNITDLLNFYKGIKHSAKGFKEEYNAIGMHLEFTDKQLSTLYTDLNNEADFKDSLELFIQNEHENLEALNQNIGTLLYNYDFIVTVHDSVSTKVQNILLQNVE